MINIAIFGSRNGSNFQSIVEAVKKNKIKNCQVSFMHSNKTGAKIIERSKTLNIKAYVLDPKTVSAKEYDDYLINLIAKYNISLICLAGYMKLLSKYFLDQVKKISPNILIINIHPSLLPSYQGLDCIKRAYLANEKMLGTTIHFVDEGLDTGEIIYQARFKRLKTFEATEDKILKTENKIYPKVINKLIKEYF